MSTTSTNEDDFHVMLDLGSKVDADLLTAAGTDYQLVGLDTATPYLRIGDLYWQGKWDIQIGSELTFETIIDENGREAAVEVAKSVKRVMFERISILPQQLTGE